MKMKVLVTGGAGFIGSHLCDELLTHGYEVRVLDNLSPQVHGERTTPPDYLSDQVEFIYGDVRDPDAVCKALQNVAAVFHLAAAVGVGQSMYEIRRYTDINNVGTAVLLEQLLDHPVQKLVVASSMSIYGEGLYRDDAGRPHSNVARNREQLARGIWEISDGNGSFLTPIATPESKPANLASIYALSKYDQECMALTTGNAYNIPAVALRFFNVYGTRQSLSNPYTGVLAIFASRFLNGKPPLVFEDGNQQRDFVHVRDIARACRLAMESDAASGKPINVGSGRQISINALARKTAKVMGRENLAPDINGEYRVGDIRHCFADIECARQVLGFEPKVDFEEGLRELADWLAGQIAEDNVESAHSELKLRGLTL